ncbi:sensor histidine kinase [Sulfurimonas sp.]|uniref:sensor histidine kinase n=1 Tax=Sulfurimonas sp. TaxID=2022749 RepID=UPI003D129E93
MDHTKECECLNAIGNTFDLESMVSEILITFSHASGGVSASFYADEGKPATIHIGTIIDPKDAKELDVRESFSILEKQALYLVVLHLNSTSLVFAYNKPLEEVKDIALTFAQFRKKIILAINACRGIAELERLNEELEDRVADGIKKIHAQEQILLIRSKQAMMGEMIEMIAHQWRQPLTAIGMNVNNLLFDLTIDEVKPEMLSHDLTTINKQIDYLSHTINDFRNFFKQDKEQELIELNELIKKALQLVEKQLNFHNISVDFSDECKIELYTFKNELIQVFLNLISNAKDAFTSRKEENTISIRCEIIEDTVEIIVSDNAGGINEEVLPHIFEPYFSTKKEKNGTGLGLYMSQIIVHEHLHGELKVKNTNVGASFYILIPYIKAPINDERTH